MLLENENSFRDLWINSSMCAACGGRCCKKQACDNAPSDFDNSIQNIEKALDTGNYTIDFARTSANSFIYQSGHLTLDIESIIEAYDETLYVRPRNLNRPIVDIIHGDINEKEGPCIFWSKEKGCALSYEERPLFGRSVIPNSSGFCVSIFPVREMLIEMWKPYSYELFVLAKKYFQSEWYIYKDFDFVL